MKLVDGIPRDRYAIAPDVTRVQLGCNSCTDRLIVEVDDFSSEHTLAKQLAVQVGSYREVWRHGEESHGLRACDDGFCDRTARLLEARERLGVLSTSFNHIPTLPTGSVVTSHAKSALPKGQNRVLYSTPYQGPPTNKAEAAETAVVVVRGGVAVNITRGNVKDFSE